MQRLTCGCPNRWYTPNKLKSISLIQNRIRNEGAAALGKAVERHPAIIHLDLSKNEVRAQLKCVCSTRKNWTSNGFCWKQIGSAGGAQLAEMVRTNIVLTSLLLIDNQIHTAGSLSFATALKSAPGSSNLTVVTGSAQNPRVSRRPVKSDDPEPAPAAPVQTRTGSAGSSAADTPGTMSRVLSVTPSERSYAEAGWRNQVESGTLLWQLCQGEQKKISYLSTYGISTVDAMVRSPKI